MNSKITTTRKRENISVALLLLWAEGGPRLRREFNGDFSRFCAWADHEVRRMLNSVSEGGADA
jgi:hypothetical protein